MSHAFEEEKRKRLANLRTDSNFQEQSAKWLLESLRRQYSYNFSWLGRPIIQYPADILAMQEIIWRVKPDLIIETGVAHGGSLIMYSSLMKLLGGDGRVVGVDIDIRPNNRAAIESHPMADRITLIQGSSIDKAVVDKVRSLASEKKQVLVALDSNHSHAHVAAELELYSPLVTKGSYLIVFDTIVEDMPAGSFPDRPWDRGNNPKTAVHEFLQRNSRFRINEEMNAKLLLGVVPDGYLECIKD